MRRVFRIPNALTVIKVTVVALLVAGLCFGVSHQPAEVKPVATPIRRETNVRPEYLAKQAQKSGLRSKLCGPHDHEEEWFKKHLTKLDGNNILSKQWGAAAMLQSLDEVSMIKTGCRALLFTRRWDVAVHLVSRGCRVTVAHSPSGPITSDNWQAAAVVPEKIAKPARDMLTFRPVDPRVLPVDLMHGDFDFVWSDEVVTGGSEILESESHIKQTLRCLSRGGVAFFTFSFDVTHYSSSVTSVKHPRNVELDLWNAAVTSMNCTVLPLDLSVDPDFAKYIGTQTCYTEKLIFFTSNIIIPMLYVLQAPTYG
eukprot:TRINITY_DN2415_c1_g2_i1.p1 TRINITY_DN2415_c1_g2~~TRINITY_DN2415_c1_g2_i1.p1  ORF type:complete len:311 (+),score=37.70 TRINITY_DN2415_c1_g2_i1:143-1075(+)